MNRSFSTIATNRIFIVSCFLFLFFIYWFIGLKITILLSGFLLTLLLGGIVFMASSGRLVLWTYISTAVVFGGLAQFYLDVQYVVWLSSFFGVALFFWTLPRNSAGGSAPKPIYVWLLIATIFYWAISAGINTISPANFLVASVSYLMPFIALFGVAKILRMRAFNKITNIELAMCLLPIVQLPFVLHQRFVLIRGTTNWDSVSGTFGGKMGGGGGNADMMMFLVAAFAMALHLRQHKKIGIRFYLIIATVVFLIIGLGETKAFFVFLPLVLLIQQLPYVLNSPIKTAISAGFLFSALYILGYSYEVFNYAARYGDQVQMSPIDRFQISFNYVLDIDNINYAEGEVGRLASLYLWAKHVATDTLGKWFGYGIGASRRSTIAAGKIASEYAPLKLGSTALAQLLWDTGYVGTSLFILTQISAVRSFLRSAARETDKYIVSRYRTIAAILLMLAVSMIYKPSLVESSSIKCLFVMLFAIGWTTQVFMRSSARERILSE